MFKMRCEGFIGNVTKLLKAKQNETEFQFLTVIQVTSNQSKKTSSDCKIVLSPISTCTQKYAALTNTEYISLTFYSIVYFHDILTNS